MLWLTENFHQLLPHPWAPVVLAPFAAFCGALVGLERERKEKLGGVRTMCMVSFGACVFTMAGTAFTGDTSRIAAQVVTGIGFLGGGVILRDAGGVRGVTTAATVWAAAAMGLVIGSGYAGAGAGLALLMLGTFAAIGFWEKSRLGGSHDSTISVIFDGDHGKTRIKVERILEEFGVPHHSAEPSESGEGRFRWKIHYRLTARHHHEFLFALAQLPEIREIER